MDLNRIITEEVNEMSSRAYVPIESDGYWMDMVDSKLSYTPCYALVPTY